jgi:hypothetical protein
MAVFLLYQESSSYKVKNAPRGCAPRGCEVCCFATPLGRERVASDSLLPAYCLGKRFAFLGFGSIIAKGKKLKKMNRDFTVGMKKRMERYKLR